MLLSSLVAVALACTAGAFPALESRHAVDRHDIPHTSSLVQLVPSETSRALAGGNVSHNQFSTTWAGAVYHGYLHGTFRHVSGTIIVPSAITPPTGGDNTTAYSGSAWVGIDGVTVCNGAILQTGIDWTVQGGKVTYGAWYEWYPAPSIRYSGGLVINPGDTLRFTVDSTSATSGVATVDNLTTGKSASQSLSSSVSLCAADAEWIVEDFTSGGNLVPFANFGAVTFSNAAAVVNGGSGGTLGPVYATLLDMRQNGTVHTQASSADATVTINYIG